MEKQQHSGLVLALIKEPHMEATLESDGLLREASFRSNLFEWQVIFRVQLEGLHYKMSSIRLGDGEELHSSNAEVIMSSGAKLF